MALQIQLFQHLLAVLGESMRPPESLFAILLCHGQSPISLGQAVWDGEVAPVGLYAMSAARAL